MIYRNLWRPILGQQLLVNMIEKPFGKQAVFKCKKETSIFVHLVKVLLNAIAHEKAVRYETYG